MKRTMEAPRIIEGGLAVDDRGQVLFVNDFDFSDVKRFYAVSNHRAGFVRAWHAHRLEGKYVFVASGTAVVGAVVIDDWERPNRAAKVHRYVLSARKPSVLYIPPGHANGFMTLQADTQLFFYSTRTLQESLQDDVRFDARYWDIWNVEER
jgi:dTDP-4-dehydrorhamnose 3,5-epimerase